MKQQKIVVIFILISCGFFGLLSLYVKNKPDQHLPASQTSKTEDKKSSKNAKNSSRELEKSEIKEKKTKIENELSALMNDPAISQAWGLKKSDAARAWSVSTGNKNIIVAVIDTGADIHHEDLAENIWKNPKEIPQNGIDDDHNGYIDDLHGWNFVSNNPRLDDNHGHGTHISGIIGAVGGNNKGIIGISPKVSLMILKYYDPKVPNTDNLKNTVNAIKYAIAMGANIINYSGGGTEFSQDEKNAVAEAEKQGIIFVAAAGNEKSNSDEKHFYPADYGLSNIISVTAIDSSTQVLSTSNYGEKTVDLAAPGQNIISTLPDNNYGYLTGTSQATAFVTGAAVLIMAHHRDFNPIDVKKYILATGDATMNLAKKTRSMKQLNLYKALTILDQGVAVNGKKTANFNQKNQVFSGIPNKRKITQDSPSDVSRFGKSLLNAIESKSKTRLGDKDLNQQ